MSLPVPFRPRLPGQGLEAAVKQVKGRHQQEEVVDLGDVEQPGVEVRHEELAGEPLPRDYRVVQGPIGPMADKGVEVPQGQQNPQAQMRKRKPRNFCKPVL